MAKNSFESICIAVLILIFTTADTLADGGVVIPANKVCVRSTDGMSYVDRHRLMNWAVGQTWNGQVLPQDIWDRDGDGDVLYQEKLFVLAKSDFEEICKSGKCVAKDPLAISTMRSNLSDVFDEGRQHHYLVVGSDGRVDKRWPQYSEEQKLVRMFDYKNPGFSGLRVRCLDTYEKDASVYTTPRLKDLAGGQFQSGLRVALNRHDLGTKRSNLRDIEPAKFSATGDFQNNSWTWAVEGYAGYQYQWGGNTTVGSIIPFVHVVEKDSDSPANDIDKLGAGLDLGIYMLGFGDIQGGFEYLSDSRAHSDILAGQVLWFPGVAGIFLNEYDEIGSTNVELKIRPRFALSGGDIVDRGDNEQLSSVTSYLRGGPGISVQFRGKTGSSLEDFEFFSDAKYLFALTGDGKDRYRIESSLHYFFPAQDNFSLGLSYAYGYQDDTVEKENLIEAVLGARF